MTAIAPAAPAPPPETPAAILAQVEAALRLNAYMGPHVATLSLPQIAFLIAPQPEVLFGGATKGGKMQPVSALVATPFGFKPMGQIQVGDAVSNPDGTTARVIAVWEHGQKDIYHVTLADGSTTQCGAEHLWLVRETGHKYKAARRYVGASDTIAARVVDTLTLQRLVARAHAQRDQHLQIRTPLLPLTEPVNFQRNDNRWGTRWPIDPYILGCILGDGHIADHTVSLTSADPEVAATFCDWVRAQGGRVTVTPRDGNAASQYTPAGIAPVMESLRRLELAGTRAATKFIPDAYQVAPLPVRYALMQGLFDTDGYVDERGHCQYTSISLRLAQDVQWVARSLGFKAHITSKLPTFQEHGIGQRAYTVYLSGRDASEIIRLPRKRARLQAPPKAGWHRVVRVEPGGQAECRCISVDHPNGLYLTDDFIVTHNTDAMLLAALQYVDVPYYQALLLDRSFPNLTRGDGIIPRMRDWTEYGVPARIRPRWDDENHASLFPSGAKVTFGFIERPGEEGRYKRANYQFIGWEELTEHPSGELPTSPPYYYTYLFSRLARPEGSPVPLRVRGDTNPDGPGRLWVKTRWGLGHDETGAALPPPPPTRLFIPSSYRDNPGIDQPAVAASLAETSAITQAQLLDGDWDVTERGGQFAVEHLRLLAQMPGPGVTARYRSWDKAGTDGADARRARRAKFTVGLRVSRVDRALYGVEYVIEDLIRGQWGVAARNRIMRETAGIYRASERGLPRQVATPDPYAVPGVTDTWIVIEQEPADAGQESAQITVSDLAGRVVEVVKPSTNKLTRARPFIAAVNAGLVGLVQAPWNAVLTAEFQAFPTGVYSDIVDAAAQAFNKLVLTAAPAAPASAPGQGRTVATGYRA